MSISKRIFKIKMNINNEEEAGYGQFTWSKNTTQNLIKLLKERPVLWDVSLSEYKNRNKRATAVSEMAKILKTTTDEVKHKIHNLRCQYGNERRKELRTKSGSGRYKSQWEFFDSLKFLFTHNSNHSNDNTDLMSHSNEDAQFKAKIITRTSESAWESSTRSINESIVKQRKKRHPYEEEEDKTLQKRFKIINTTQIDEWTTFGNFVAAELRSLEGAPDLRSKCKRDIQRVLLEVADEYANRNASSVTFDDFQ